ncbi:hypothetical protein NLS97_001875 [Campylobacter jejuni]|nr:hypothetical protein [Campylobacter jejuni]
MDGYNIAILIGAITLVFGILVLVAHYLNDKYTNESKSQKPYCLRNDLKIDKIKSKIVGCKINIKAARIITYVLTSLLKLSSLFSSLSSLAPTESSSLSNLVFKRSIVGNLEMASLNSLKDLSFIS